MKNIENLNDRKLKIFMVGAEVSPYSTVGGLSAVISYLSKALVNKGHNVKVFMPKYSTIDEQKYNIKILYKGLKVPTGYPKEERKHPLSLTCNIKYTEINDNLTVYFLENMEYYEKRSNVYAYSDDHVRWALLSYGALRFLTKCIPDWKPDVIHVNDWHTALIPNIINEKYSKTNEFEKTLTVLSIHSIAHQGLAVSNDSDLHYDDGRSRIPKFYDSRLRQLNYLKRGILYSDVVSTVSETYAKEILTEKYGAGLHKLLQELRYKLTGIVNGIDHEKMNPETDPLLEARYNVDSIENRIKNKAKLQSEMGLTVRDDVFLIGSVGRLDYQKGIDLLIKTVDKFLRDFDAQFVLVGGGDLGYQNMAALLQEKYPKRVGVHLFPNFQLPKLVFSGADVMPLPSRFEPCGIVQLEALRYGAVPVVRSTGGLKDTVKDFDPNRLTGNGFKFKEFDGWSLYGQLVRAFETFRDKDVWKKIQQNAMNSNYSWENVSTEYINLYSKHLKLKLEKID